MLQNTSVAAFTVSELLRENQQWGVKLPPTQIRVKESTSKCTIITKQKYQEPE